MYQNIGRWSFLFGPYEDEHQSNLIACMWENICYVNLGNYILSRMTFRRYLAHSAMKLLSQSDGTFLNQGMCFLTQRRSKECKALFILHKYPYWGKNERKKNTSGVFETQICCEFIFFHGNQK